MTTPGGRTRAERIAHLGHLARRFAGSWSRAEPPVDDLAWAESLLTPEEVALWRAAALPDRRHSIAVARRSAAAGVDERTELAAALLHDIGKAEPGLGTLSRVGATVYGAVRGIETARRGRSRWARHLDHEARGAALLAGVGSDPLTVALVAGTLPADDPRRRRLEAADDV